MTLQNCLVVQHHQTWKLREHHLLAPDLSLSDPGIEPDVDRSRPLRPGHPLQSFFPTGAMIRENPEGLQVREPGRKEALHYRRTDLQSYPMRNIGRAGQSSVLDIIITGEVSGVPAYSTIAVRAYRYPFVLQGHSAWGQFSLRGRVRPCDGFISLSKEYVGHLLCYPCGLVLMLIVCRQAVIAACGCIEATWLVT
jgi:hypothetical protein